MSLQGQMHSLFTNLLAESNFKMRHLAKDWILDLEDL